MARHSSILTRVTHTGFFLLQVLTPSHRLPETHHTGFPITQEAPLASLTRKLNVSGKTSNGILLKIR